jgi:parvulin-like peptidyl-prolyl isomerase
MVRIANLAAALLCAGSFVSLAVAASEAGPPSGQAAVVATVGGEPIDADEVDRLVRQAAGGQQINPAVLPWLQAQALDELIDRRLALAYAGRTECGASQAEVDAAVAALRSRLAAQGESLEAYLKEKSLTEADLRRQIVWDLTWPKLVARDATDQRLRSYFDANRRELDGTELAVSQVLLRWPEGGGSAAVKRLTERAAAIRQEIVGGKLPFAEAARKHSEAPSAAEGGRLGFIARHGTMPEAFAKAAFALEPGEISPPVVTPFGVHLIRCDEVRPGTKQWTDVRPELEAAVARRLLDRLARYQRRFTPVAYTGRGPYFKPDTTELVVP